MLVLRSKKILHVTVFTDLGFFMQSSFSFKANLSRHRVGDGRFRRFHSVTFPIAKEAESFLSLLKSSCYSAMPKLRFK